MKDKQQTYTIKLIPMLVGCIGVWMTTNNLWAVFWAFVSSLTMTVTINKADRF